MLPTNTILPMRAGAEGSEGWLADMVFVCSDKLVVVVQVRNGSGVLGVV